MRAALWLLLCAACPGSASRGSSPPGAADPQCKAAPAERAACDARGSDYHYMGDPLFGCSGVDLGDERSREVERQRRDQPCMCLSTADAAERQQRCASTP